MTDLPPYWGNQSYPADLTGTAPVRGRAVRVLHQWLELNNPVADNTAGGLATEIVEELIRAGVLPDERIGRQP